MSGPIINFTGDFSTENRRVEELVSAVDSAISAMESQVDALGNCWKDDKSEAFLTAFSTDLSELKKKNTECKTNVESTLSEIQKVLNIYTN